LKSRLLSRKYASEDFANNPENWASLSHLPKRQKFQAFFLPLSGVTPIIVVKDFAKNITIYNPS
jgi:hypothetical protein